MKHGDVVKVVASNDLLRIAPDIIGQIGIVLYQIERWLLVQFGRSYYQDIDNDKFCRVILKQSETEQITDIAGKLDASGVCKRYDICKRTVDRMVKDGRFPRPVYINGVRKWTWKQIIKYES